MVQLNQVLVSLLCQWWDQNWSWNPSFPLSWLVLLPFTVWSWLSLLLVLWMCQRLTAYTSKFLFCFFFFACFKVNKIYANISVFNYRGFIHLGAGLSVGFSGLAAGFAIGIVGDAGVRGTAQQPRLFVGMILILIFAEVLGLYGLIVAIYLYTK